MWFSFWLRKWKLSAPTARRRTQTSLPQRASFRPRLEALEDRVVPSHGHGGGSGGGSSGGLPYATAGNVKQLLADINYANTAGGAITINLAPGVTFDLKSANNTTNGGNMLPVIGGNITILGHGDTIERIDSINRFGETTNQYRLFDVAQGASLTLDRVTLRNGVVEGSGAGADGGAIYNQGTLKVSNGSTLSGNFARDGGGIYNAGGTVAISSSTLSGNSAYDGGGIYNAGGTVVVSNSILSGSIGHNGGGIYNAGGTVTVSNNSTLSGNHAEYVIPGYGDASGGGEGGGVCNASGVVTVSHSTLSDNLSDIWGGGIYNGSGTAKVSNSSILSGNSADYGGGIYINAGTLTLSNSTLSGNSAGSGGGIYIGGGAVSASTCTLSGNSADYGGGIFVAPASTLTVKNSDFENNSPDNIYGTYTDGGDNTGLP